MLVIMHWLNIVLIIIFVVQGMVIFMDYFMASGVLMFVVVALAIMSKAVSMLIGSHVTI